MLLCSFCRKNQVIVVNITPMRGAKGTRGKRYLLQHPVTTFYFFKIKNPFAPVACG